MGNNDNGKNPGLERRPLGKTGETLSVIGMGGIVVMGMEQPKANAIIAEAIDRGVNYFDVAPSYGDGEAEEKLGPGLAGKRDGVFLACKTGRRDRQGAAEELERSLRRLRTDHFDLYQMHGLTSVDEVQQALGPGGVIETFLAAREKGQVRFLGFSAHSADAAILAMNSFPFDTILFPFNWVCWSQGNFGPQVMAAAREKGIGMLALKAMAFTQWKEGANRDYSKCWYQPVSDPTLAAQALRFTLSLPVTAAVPPGEESLFRLALDTAESFKPMSAGEMGGLLSEAKGVEPIFRSVA